MLRAGELLEQHEVRLDRVGALAVADVLEHLPLQLADLVDHEEGLKNSVIFGVSLL